MFAACRNPTGTKRMMFQNSFIGGLVELQAHLHFYSFVSVFAHEFVGELLIDLSQLLKGSDMNKSFKCNIAVL